VSKGRIPVKIATYNVNSVNARLPVLLRWLAETRPDVACLQELKAPQEKFPAEALRDAGYRAIWHGQKAWNGVAILARAGEPTETGRGLAGDPDDVQSRYPKGRSAASASAASTCRTATRPPARSSTTSSAGSNASRPAPRNW